MNERRRRDGVHWSGVEREAGRRLAVPVVPLTLGQVVVQHLYLRRSIELNVGIHLTRYPLMSELIWWRYVDSKRWWLYWG